MVILVKLFAIAIVVLGVVFLLSPKAIKQYMNFWAKGKNYYLAGILSILFSIVFLLAASQCKLPLVVAVLGIWSLIKGIVILVRGPEKLKSMIDWWMKRPIGVLRLTGFLALAIGVLLIYSA